MSAARDILKNFNLFVDGRGYAGNADQIQLPALSVQLEDYRGGGMDAPVGLDMGMEKLESSFVLSKFDPDSLGWFGLSDGNVLTVIARGTLQSFNGAESGVEVVMQGKVVKVEFGAWEPGTKSANTYTMNLQYYRYTQGGRVVHEIDVVNMIRRINGIDQLAQQRANLGV